MYAVLLNEKFSETTVFRETTKWQNKVFPVVVLLADLVAELRVARGTDGCRPVTVVSGKPGM